MIKTTPINIEIANNLLFVSFNKMFEQINIETSSEVIGNIFEAASRLVEYCYKSGGLKACGDFNPPIVIPPIEFCIVVKNKSEKNR